MSNLIFGLSVNSTTARGVASERHAGRASATLLTFLLLSATFNSDAKKLFSDLAYNKAVSAWAGARDGKDVGNSGYLSFAGADSYGGKTGITTQFFRQGPPVTTAPQIISLAQRTDVMAPTATRGAELDQYNETLWFQTEFPLWAVNSSVLGDRFATFRPINVQTGALGQNSFSVPLFNCFMVSGPVECGLAGANPTAKAGACVGYFRRIQFLTQATFIAAPDSSNGSYSYGLDACSLRYANLTSAPITEALYAQELAQEPNMYWCWNYQAGYFLPPPPATTVNITVRSVNDPYAVAGILTRCSYVLQSSGAASAADGLRGYASGGPHWERLWLPALAALAACTTAGVAAFRRLRAQLPAPPVSELELPITGPPGPAGYGAVDSGGSAYGAGGDKRRRPAPVRQGIGAEDVALSVEGDHEYGWLYGGDYGRHSTGPLALVLGDEMSAAFRTGSAVRAGEGSAAGARRAPLSAAEFRGGALGPKGAVMRVRTEDEAAGF